jgi:hypothetical protein
MAKQIARLLRTDVMADIDVPAIAQFLQSQGRRGDSVLAHINPKEAALLKKMGGAETVNPVTGLPEYFQITDYGSGYGSDYDSQPSLRYRPPAQTTNILDQADFNIESYRSPYTLNEYAQPINLTPPDIDPVEYNLNRAAQQQYAGSAFPYDLTGKEGYQEIPENLGISDWSQYKPEFPAGMSARMSLPSVSGAAMPTPYDISPNTRVGLQFGGATGLQAPDIGGAALAPELTVPERVSAAQLGPASMAARQAADRELARETTAPGVLDRASAATGLSKEALARLGLAGLGTIQGIYASRQAAEQGREARRETEALARPYQQRGQELIQQAQRGELTPQGQQSLQALRARLAQGAEARGGVGAAQAAAQIEAYRQNLLQNQFDYGQKISNIGDQLMLGAIRTGLEADRYASNLSNTYFTNMARIAAGVPTGTQGA